MTNRPGVIRTSAGTVAASAVVLVIVLIIGAMWVFGVGMFRRETADFRGGTRATEQIHANGQYRIAAYDRFFAECSQVQALGDQMANLQAELDATTDQLRRQDLATSMTALRNQRVEAIRTYNADASRTGTVGQFRDSQLPYHIDPTAKDVTCAS